MDNKQDKFTEDHIYTYHIKIAKRQIQNIKIREKGHHLKKQK